LELPSCCRRAFVTADRRRDGNPAAFTCDVHGTIDSAIDIVARAMAKNGVARFRIWTCSCGQKNRVDAAKVVGLAAQVKCGKCSAIVKHPE